MYRSNCWKKLFLSQCAFLVWCMAPTPTNGSIQIYQRIIRPFFLKNEGKIDDAMKNITDKAAKTADKVKEEGITRGFLLLLPF